MPAEECFPRSLYGGAISCSLPMRFQDLSNIQEVPNHQEVFADPSRDESLIIELLDYKHDVEDNGSAVWFLQDLGSEQDAKESVLLEQSEIVEAVGLRYRDAPSVVTIAVGQMAVSKGRQGREAQNMLRVYLANLRLKGAGTDVLITAYEPLFIKQAVRDIFLPYLDGAIWFQNASLYHFSMFHASHHLTPIRASDTEIEAEASAVKAVAQSLCPLKIFLDRVVLTSTGVLLGCWQVISGPDPSTIRAKLRNALPHSPEKQLYDPVMLHTSFARILGHPKAPSKEMKASDELKLFHELIAHLNNEIQGFKAAVSELWFVEEFDVLALALDGRMKAQKFPFDDCSSLL